VRLATGVNSKHAPIRIPLTGRPAHGTCRDPTERKEGSLRADSEADSLYDGSVSPAALNRYSTAAELGKVEFALIKASLTAGYELRQSVVVLLLDRYWAS